MLVVQVLREFAVEGFFPTSQESEGFFLPTSYVQGYVRGSLWVRQGRWLPRRKDSACPRPRISFLVHEYWVLRDPSRLNIGSYETQSTRKPCAKEVPETDYHMQREQYLNRTTLHRMKIPLRSIHSKGGRNIALERNVSEKAVKWQATIKFFSRVGNSYGIPYLGCTP